MDENLRLTLSKIETKFSKQITSNIHIGRNLTEQIINTCTNKRTLIISDHNIITNNQSYIDTLKQRLKAKSYILSNPKCDKATAYDLLGFTDNIDIIIAIGSGTINDLCKYIADQKKINYIVIASAYSMNGYLSHNTSITIDGHKKTLPAKAPTHAFFDLEILDKSPIRLTKSGVFDVTCSYLIQNDWLTSNFLEMDHDYEPFYFEIQNSYLDSLYDNLDKVFNNSANDSLLNLLIITGILMNFCNSSKPASQGEHLIVHLLDMTDSFKAKYFHGEQVLIGSVLSYQIQSYLTINYENYNFKPLTNLNFDAIFPAQYAQSCKTEFEKKTAKINLNTRLANTRHYYTKILPQIIHNLTLTKNFFTKFSQHNISLKPSDYIKDAESTDFALKHASLIRDRFTHLDLLLHGQI